MMRADGPSGLKQPAAAAANKRNVVWMVAGAVWSRRLTIFYGVSAVSLASNTVALAQSWQVRASLARLLHLLVSHLRDLATLLQHRPVLYILLNLLMLFVLLKSGLLSGRANSKRQLHVDDQAIRAMREDAGKGWQGSSPYLSNQLNDADKTRVILPQLVVSSMRKKRALSGDLLAFTSTSSKSSTCNMELAPTTDEAEKLLQPNISKNLQSSSSSSRRASLFTIEPLVNTRELANFRAPATIATTISDPQELLENLATPIGATHNNWHHHHHGSPDDYDLNCHEFNARVEGFIAKFKRNLTMQRENSLNRLLNLMQGKR